MDDNTDGWATDDLVYKWKDVDPVQIVPGLHLPRFTLEQYKSAYCNVITNTGACQHIRSLFPSNLCLMQLFTQHQNIFL